MTWKYDIIRLRPDADEEHAIKTLDRCGHAGWELVAVVPAGANWYNFFFKKPDR